MPQPIKNCALGSAFVSVAGALPPSAIVINITYGLGIGVEHEVTRDGVEKIITRYAGEGVQP